MIDTIEECFASNAYPWSSGGDLWFCAQPGDQTMIVIVLMGVMWLSGIVLGSVMSR